MGAATGLEDAFSTEKWWHWTTAARRILGRKQLSRRTFKNARRISCSIFHRKGRSAAPAADRTQGA